MRESSMAPVYVLHDALLGISDSASRHQPAQMRDDKVIAKLIEAAERYPAYGFSKLYKILRRWGHGWNHKRVHRVYCEPNFNKRRRGKRRLSARNPEPLAVPAQADHCWSMDFSATACNTAEVSERSIWSTTSTALTGRKYSTCMFSKH